MDLAGLNDSGGELIEFVNQMINKKIFNNAKQVTFLITISIYSLLSERGNGIREQVDLFLKIFDGQLDTAKNSI